MLSVLENGQASAALVFKQLTEAQDKGLPAPVCKACGEELKVINPTKSERIFHLKRMKAMLKSGQIAYVLSELALHDSHEDVAKCIRHYNANLDRMRNHEYAERGLPLGPGLIEGSCKNVVPDRPKRGGSCWSAKGANGIMAIRCMKKNNRITDFFDWRAAA